MKSTIRSRVMHSLLFLAACLIGTAQAESCGSNILITNDTKEPISILIKSFYGVNFSRPDPADFSDVRTPWVNGLPFTRVYEFTIEPASSSQAYVRTLCPSNQGRKHWVNWRQTEDANSVVSGQIDLITERAEIHIRRAGA